MKFRTLLFLVLILLMLSSLKIDGYSVNIRIYNNYVNNNDIIIMLEYNDTMVRVSGNDTLNIPNETVTLIVYNLQMSYNILINGNNTNEYTFSPSKINTINITVIPKYVNISLNIKGNGEIQLKFSNGTTKIINKSTTLQVLCGSLITLYAKPLHDSFLGWNNSSAYNTLFIIAQNSTTITAEFGQYKSNTTDKVNLSNGYLYLVFLIILGGFYLFLKRKKSI
ncbi:hypothetical protein DFR86_02200 [Acidianus sulfidivorans JP7]|uniref:Bacterial repeat domain-containing protein n=1 Tax=Acidianus sulfidivorans JP7 TaxID=619593 RepID=A0A2U9IKC5_9CREN|nr:hypothetical protein [Acidianus sulfidivorans]AWR96478.1 hypothetical protein DFR86_02200 [Acidianus sulfidivorans JP7]